MHSVMHSVMHFAVRVLRGLFSPLRWYWPPLAAVACPLCHRIVRHYVPANNFPLVCTDVTGFLHGRNDVVFSQECERGGNDALLVFRPLVTIAVLHDVGVATPRKIVGVI